MTSARKNKLTFKKTYIQYVSVLVNFVFSETMDRELSREIVQNAFAQLWLRRNNSELKSFTCSYSFMMLRNAIIDHFHLNNGFSESSVISDQLQYHVKQGSVEEDVLLKKHTIRKTLEEMKAKRKLIFELSRFEKLTYSEIAYHLGISERDVEDNISKALLQLEGSLTLIKQKI